MTAPPYARTSFGLSAVLFGIVSLMWPDSDLWQHLHAIAAPASHVIAWTFTIALIAGGIGVLLAQTARSASAVLAVAFLLLSLADVPGMIAAPRNPDAYIDFFEILGVVCGAVAVLSAALERIARLVLGVCTASFAWAQIVYLKYTASLVPAWIPPGQMFWTILTTIAFALAAIAMLVNRQAQLAARLTALMIALFGLLVWAPHVIAKPHALGNWSEFAINFLIAGAAWLVADAK